MLFSFNTAITLYTPEVEESAFLTEINIRMRGLEGGGKRSGSCQWPRGRSGWAGEFQPPGSGPGRWPQLLVLRAQGVLSLAPGVRLPSTELSPRRPTP